MNLGQAIIHLRVNRMKQTQDLFAHNVGITQTYLSQIENGKKNASIGTNCRIRRRTITCAVLV